MKKWNELTEEEKAMYFNLERVMLKDSIPSEAITEALKQSDFESHKDDDETYYHKIQGFKEALMKVLNTATEMN